MAPIAVDVVLGGSSSHTSVICNLFLWTSPPSILLLLLVALSLLVISLGVEVVDAVLVVLGAEAVKAVQILPGTVEDVEVAHIILRATKVEESAWV